MNIPENLGPTGEFPDGRICGSDGGELRYAVGHDRSRRFVAIAFGTPIEWLAMSPSHARHFAFALFRAAEKAEEPQ